MKKKLYTAPESIVVEIETSSIMDAFTGSTKFDPTKPGDYDGSDPTIQPESGSRRGNDWTNYFGY